MNKDYFKSLIKKNKKLNIVLFIAFFLSYPFLTILSFGDNPGSVKMDYLYLMVIITTLILPVYNIKMFQSKKAIDTYFALPIKKIDLMKSTLFYTIIQISINFTFSFILGLFISKLWFGFGLINIVSCILVTILSITIIVTVNFFIVEKCNNTLDSVIILTSYHLLLLAIYQGVSQFARNVIPYSNGFIRTIGYADLAFILSHFNPYTLLVRIFLHFELIKNSMFYQYSEPEIVFPYLLLGIQVIIGIFAYILLMKSFNRRKAEDSETLTNNKWTYPFIINAFTIAIIMCLDFARGFMYYLPLLVIVIVGNLVITFISQRKIKITKKTLLLLMSSFVVVLILSKIAFHTNFFNLAYSFEMHDTSIELIIVHKIDDGGPGEDTITTYIYQYELAGSEDDKQMLNEFQKEIVDEFYELNKLNTYDGKGNSVTINYEDGQNDDQVYTYRIKEPQILSLLDELEKLGYEGTLINEY